MRFLVADQKFIIIILIEDFDADIAGQATGNGGNRVPANSFVK
ncbi:MAG: hypothetical protein ABI653_06770 [Bacteroidota bacterium]